MVSTYRGSRDDVKQLVNECWELYYAGQYSRMEDALRRLRRASPHHAREFSSELDDLISGQEDA